MDFFSNLAAKFGWLNGEMTDGGDFRFPFLADTCAFSYNNFLFFCIFWSKFIVYNYVRSNKYVGMINILMFYNLLWITPSPSPQNPYSNRTKGQTFDSYDFWVKAACRAQWHQSDFRLNWLRIECQSLQTRFLMFTNHLLHATIKSLNAATRIINAMKMQEN